MRICHICSSFPPAVGGNETHNYSIVKYLTEKGYRVDVIVVQLSRKLLLQKNYNDKTIETLSQPSYILPELPNTIIHNIIPRPLKIYYDLAKKVRELERDGKIDILDIHSYLFVLPFGKKRKTILSLHSYEMSCPKTDPPLPCEKGYFVRCRKCCGTFRYLYWKVTRYLARRKISKFMVKYEYLKAKLIESGVESEKIAVIPHWIDIARINSAPGDSIFERAISVDNSSTTISFVGRLSDFNGPFLALEALKKLDGGTLGGIKLVFIGGGELRDKIQSFCSNNGIADRVQLVGNMPHEQLLRSLPLFDIHVMSSPYDNYNWTLLELMSSGKPVIATNVGGTAEILKDGYNALLAEPTPESIASKMKQLMENPELGKRLAANALKTVKNRHSMKNLEKYEKLAEELSRWNL